MTTTHVTLRTQSSACPSGAVRGSRPPPAKPLQRRTTRVSGLFRRRTVATPLWTSPAPSGTTPGYGFAQADAPRDAVPADTPLGSTRASPAFNPPAGVVVATPDTPTRRPSRHVSTTLGPARAQLTFGPPADAVILDTSAGKSKRLTSPTRRSRSTLDPPADGSTLKKHSRMFSRRASTIRKAESKPEVGTGPWRAVRRRSTASPLGGSSAESSS
ncbi:unnamed protein product [Arctogadus glacialis]